MSAAYQVAAVNPPAKQAVGRLLLYRLYFVLAALHWRRATELDRLAKEIAREESNQFAFDGGHGVVVRYGGGDRR